jgi:hypothetical protein
VAEHSTEAEVEKALARYREGKASDAEVVALMRQLINTGSIKALRGAGSAGDPSHVWASIIPVGGGLDIWIDGERRGSATTPALARYRVVVSARPARVTWTDLFTARWERVTTDPQERRRPG